MARALVVGFILGFALIGVLRMSAIGSSGPQLASGPALALGAANNHVLIPGTARPRF